MPKRTKDYHAWLLKRLASPREAERYLKVAMADSSEMFLKALRNVAEANKMAKVAEEAGVNRESLYKALSEDGNPRFSTLDSVLSALGMSLTVQLKQPVPAPSMPPIGSQEQTITVAFETGGNTKITSTASTEIRNVTTFGNDLILTSPTVTSSREQSEWAYTGTLQPGFIAYATGAEQSSINALGD